jgi:drug/metabolite transporter (DMT)-like permease
VSNLALASVAALGSAAFFSSAVTLQALEARSAPETLQLRPALIVFLFRRPRWVLGTALGVLGWPLQAVALAYGPLALVQPILALSVIGLLAAGHRILREPVGGRSVVAAVAILGGIGLLALVAPTDTATGHGALPIVTLAVLGACSLIPFARARARGRSANALALAAGTAYVLLALATTLLDGALGRSAWWSAVVWLAICAGGAAIGSLTEMSAFRLAPATVVAPIIFCVETVGPALLAPIFGQHLGTDGQSLAIDLAGLALVGIGVALLARSRPVADLMAAGK